MAKIFTIPDMKLLKARRLAASITTKTADAIAKAAVLRNEKANPRVAAERKKLLEAAKYKLNIEASKIKDIIRDRNIYDKDASEKDISNLQQAAEFVHNKYPTLLEAIRQEEKEK